MALIIDQWHELHRNTPAAGFGSDLAGILTRRGLSYKQAANQIGCNYSYISRIVSGDRKPTCEMISMIVRSLYLTDRERLRLTILAGYVPSEMVLKLLTEIDRQVA